MYALTIAVNHKELGPNADRISAKVFERDNEDIALNILYVPFEKKEIRPEYVSRHNFERKNQVILLKISDNKGTWHFLALKSEPTEDGYMRPIKSLSRLLRDKSSNSHVNHYCYGCFHSFRCQSTLEKHTLKCNDHDYCKVDLAKEGENFKKHKFETKSLRMNDIIYMDLEWCYLSMILVQTVSTSHLQGTLTLIKYVDTHQPL